MEEIFKKIIKTKDTYGFYRKTNHRLSPKQVNTEPNTKSLLSSAAFMQYILSDFQQKHMLRNKSRAATEKKTQCRGTNKYEKNTRQKFLN